MSIKSRRIIALLLCFVMVFTAMPVSAFAVEDPVGQVTEQNESEAVVSPDDVSADIDEQTTTEDNPTADVDNEPAVEDETPAVEEETPAVEEETPAVEEETPAVEEETPAVEDETPAVEDETPAVEEETPAVEEEIPAIDEIPVLGGAITEQYGIMLLNEVMLLGDATGTVYISISYDGKYVNGNNEKPVAYVPVSLSDLQEIKLADYGLTDYDYNGQLTALHLYIYAHENIMGKEWSEVDVQGSAGSIFFANGLFGFSDCNLQYYCNGEYPEVDGWGVTADQLVLEDGNFYDIAAYTSWSFYSDSNFGFHYFLDDSDEIIHEYTATAGEALTVTLGRGASYMGSGYSMTKVADYTVSYGAEVGAADGTVTTNADGQAEITFDEAGTYYLWVDGGYGAENPLDIVSAPGYAEVTVEEGEEPSCETHDWKDATCSAPKTCAACGATDGDVDPDAHNYVDGKCEYCGEAEPFINPFTATADGEAVEIAGSGETEDVCTYGPTYKLSVTVPAGTDELVVNCPDGGWGFYEDHSSSNRVSSLPATVQMDDGHTLMCLFVNGEWYHIYIYEAVCEHSYVDGTCEYCGKAEIEPTHIIKAGTGWSSIDWPYAGCNINRVTVTNVKVDEFTQNGSNYYITLDSAVADDAAVELGIGTNLQYSNLWVLVDDQCITESPITASTDLTTTVQLVDGAATVKIGGCPGYNTGSYIQSYAVNKTFYFSNSGQFPIAPMLSGGSSTSALRVEDDTWTADLSTLFKNISDKEVTYKVAIDGAEAVECAADYTYTCDTPGTRKLVFTAVNDYGTSPNYTATISVLPAEAVKETNHEVQGGTITWFAFTDDKLNALPEGTTYEWDAETTTWTITQPSDINVTGKVITYYNLEKDDPTAKLPLLSGSNAVAGAGTMWDGAVRNQQTNTLSNGAVSTYVYLFEKTPTSNAADQYTVIRFNYDREKPETYFEYKVDGNAELTIVGDVGGVNGHQWTGDREVHVALNAETPADAVISCVEKNNTVTLVGGAGQFSYKTGPWYDEKTWYVKYKIDQFPVLIDSENTTEDVTVPALSTYTVDLAQLFSDADEADTLTYQVKLNDGAWTNIEGSEYSFTPDAALDYVLTFRAYDGFVYAKDTYTINMTATNSTENYGIVVIAPDDVKFYCTTGFDAEGKDLLGEEIAVTTFENSEICVLNVPKNVSRISWRDAEGAGMSAPVEVNNSIVLVEASFKAMAGETESAGTLAVKYGDYTAVGVDNNYLLMNADDYTYVFTPADANYRTYNEGEKTPVAGENVIDLTLKHITVIAPAGSTVSSGRFYSYFRYDFNEPQQTVTLDDGRISVDFPVPGSESFIRVQHPDGVTYWDFGNLSDGTTREVTEDMLFIGSDEFTKETVYDNYQKNSHDIADLYLTVNAQGWLDMASGDVHSLNVFRNWIPVANSTSNNGVSLPDVTYTVVDINGEPADDVVTVTPDANNSCYADITAVGAGTAIILVTYDAVYNADGEGGKQFSAVWPENTGVIVVTVDAEKAGIATNMTVNEAANAGGKQILDVEHDILFYVGDEGAEYSFTPEEGCTVTVARSTVDDEMTFNGFTDENVTVANDGTVTVSALTTGTHIIKVEKDGKAAYQVIRAREVEYKLTHSDGTEVTAANPAKAGEAITVQFSKLIAPLGKLSGVYNANFGFYYNGEDGAAYRVASGYAYGDYYFGSNAVRQKFTATVPAEWDGDTYTLTDGAIKLGGFGGSFGAHRSTSYMVGKDVNTNASGTAGQASVLPDVVIPTGTPAYTVTLPTETVGYTVTAAEGSTSPVAEGGDYSFTVTISEGYEAGEEFAVKANDVTLTAVEDVYTIENITADQTVTVEGVVEEVVEPTTYTVTLPTETVGYTVTATEDSASPVTEGGDYSFTVTISEGYEAGEEFAVKANDVTLTAVEDVYTIANITADQTVTVDGVVETYPVTVTAPIGSMVSVGTLRSYYIYTFSEPIAAVDDQANGTVTYGFDVPTAYGNSFVRVQHPEGVTYWDYVSMSEGTEINITEDMLFMNDGKHNPDTIIRDLSEYEMDVADVYINANAQGYMPMTIGETHEFNVFRDWHAVEGISNAKTALPDVSYKVIDIDGNESDIVSIVPDENNSSVATMTANEEGTAIVLVTYDAMYSTLALRGGIGTDPAEPAFFSAIWPENTGVLVVTVGSDGSDIQTNMTLNGHALDAEHDVFYYLGAEGASYSFKPDSGSQVSVARAALTEDSLTYSGFTTDGVTVNEDGSVTVSGLTAGSHIIKVENDGAATYQVICAKQTTVTITDSNGEEITVDNPADPGETVTVQLGSIYNPVNKLSGVYNSNCGIVYSGEDNKTFNGGRGSGFGYYLFAADPEVHKVSVTLPEVWADDTYSLTGYFSIGGNGKSAGAHRDLTYATGLEMDSNAPATAGLLGSLPQVDIPVNASERVAATEVTLNKTSLKINIDGVEMLTATVAPEGCTDSVSWTSSAPDIATVSKDGLVTGVAAGEAVITATAGDVSASCTVTVSAQTAVDLVLTTEAAYENEVYAPTMDFSEIVISGLVPSGTMTGVEVKDGKNVITDKTCTISLAPGEYESITITLKPLLGSVAQSAVSKLTYSCGDTTSNALSTYTDFAYTTSVTPVWENGQATLDLKLTLNGKNVRANYTINLVIEEGSTPEPATYTVTLPTETEGYTVAATEGSVSPVTEGGNYSFTVAISDGYEAGEEFAVKANDVVLTAVDGVYTIENITADQTVTVDGVVEKEEEISLTWQEVMAKTEAYLTGQAENKAPTVGSQNGEWLVLGLARNDVEADFYDAYYENVVEYVANKIDAETGRLHTVKSTDNSRIILALSALGKDVTDVGGYDLLQGLSDTDYVTKQGINGPVWALIALDSGNYDIPANADSDKQVTREWLVDYILDKELSGGGWGLAQTPDDMTPMAVQALAPYYESDNEVKEAVDRALTVMTTMSATPETYAQMIVALSALGIDCETDEQFVVDGVSVLDKMLNYAMEDGSFQNSLTSGANQMSTEQAFYGMVAYDRFLDVKTSLYDMTDVIKDEGDAPIIEVDGITLSESSASVKVGKNVTITAVVSPSDATDKTVTWTSSDTNIATVDNGTITGISKGTVTITATAGAHSATCTVTVTGESSGGSSGGSTGSDFGLAEDEIEGYVYVSFEDKGKRKADELADIEPKFQSQLGTIIGRTKVPFKADDTIASVTLRLLDAKGFDASYEGDEFGSFYLEAIGDFTIKGTHYDSFGEFDAGQDSGWMITWNDWFIDQGASEFTVKNGDVIKWQYTCQLGADIGDDYFEREEGSTSGGGGSSAVITGEDRAAAKDVKDLISAIGTIDKDSAEAIKAARAAYDKLTDTQKELVPNYDELAAAEKAYAELTGVTIAPAEDTFADVKDHWAVKAIKYVADKGLMKGEGDNSFAPELATSRAMIAAILYRLSGSPAVDGEASFADVADGAWYADAVRWAEVNNFVSGYPDGSFGPNDNITREQLASILYRYAAANGQSMNAAAGLSQFADADTVGEWAIAAMQWANAEGLITGKTGNVIDAKGNATRAEVATILMRYLENIAA